MSFNENGPYEDEIELKTLITTLWDFRSFITRITLLFGVMALLISGAIHFLSNPIISYEAKTVVELTMDGPYQHQKQAYVSLLNSSTTLNRAKKEVEVENISISDIKVTEVGDTNIVEVVVLYQNSERAKDIANAIVNQSIIVSNDSLKGVKVSSREMASLTGNTTSSKELPNVVLNTVIALVLGGMTSVFMVFFMEYLLGKVKTKDDIERSVHIEVLTSLPNTVDEGKQGWWPWKN